MHDFEAMCSLRRSRCVSLSVRSLEMPVDECPYGARGASFFLCPWSALRFSLLHMYNKPVLQYCCRYKKTTTTTKEHGQFSI